MPTELEELVGFLGTDNIQIRQLALDHLVGYSTGPDSHVFTPEGLKPVKDLKKLAADIAPRAKNALTILVNLCDNVAVAKELAEDEEFVSLMLTKIASTDYTNCDEIAMLLANITKNVALSGRLVRLKLAVPKGVSDSAIALDQLMDCFVKGAEGALNPSASFDFLSYVFANISSTAEGRKYFVTRQDYDGVVPIQKLVVFTEHKSQIRRNGVASTIKNCCFDTVSHPMLLAEDGVDLLPYILLPIMGSETYSDEDTDGMPDELQLLPPDKEREPVNTIIITHLESLLLLTTTRFGRDYMREKKVYPVVRETHIAVHDDDVEAACDRVVQMLMRDEPDAEQEGEEDAEEDDVVEIV